MSICENTHSHRGQPVPGVRGGRVGLSGAPTTAHRLSVTCPRLLATPRQGTACWLQAALGRGHSGQPRLRHAGFGGGGGIEQTSGSFLGQRGDCHFLRGHREGS